MDFVLRACNRVHNANVMVLICYAYVTLTMLILHY